MPFTLNSLSPGQPLRLARTALIAGLLFYLVDTALTRFALNDSWMILWPLNGITICILLMRPRAEWPAYLLGISFGLGISNIFRDGIGLWFTILSRLLSVAEVVLCALILPRFTQLDLWLRSPRLPLRFCAALLIGPGISGVLFAVLVRGTIHLSFFAAFNGWAIADALGIAATLPFALSVRSLEMRALFAPRALLRTFGVLFGAWATTVLIFRVEHPPLLFLLYPALLAVDLILGFAGASLCALGTCLLSVYITVHHPGPLTGWADATGIHRDLFLQAYLGFHLLALLPASIVLLERRRFASQLVDANAQLTLLASLNGLTGIANRRAFDERFAREWNAATRHGTGLALVMIDIDYFKLYNDQYGHLGGDACLRTIATVLLNVVARPLDLPARYGGEEFVILLPDTSLEGALHLAEQLRLAVFDQAIEHRDSPSKRVTLSLGCAAIKPLPGDANIRLLEFADQALYHAKQSGRNAVRSFHPDEVLCHFVEPMAVGQS